MINETFNKLPLSAGDASRLFADCGELALDRYPLLSDNGDGWHSKYISLESDPFHHEYTEVTDETVVHNSHGTDVDDYHYTRALTPEEAARRLSEKYPEAAELLEAFEASCRTALERCTALLAKIMPDCEVLGPLYNSWRSTVLRVRKAGGSEAAVKISRTTTEDLAGARGFLKKLRSTGARNHILTVEALIDLPCPAGGGNARVAIARMPLLKPAWRCRRVSSGGRYTYLPCDGEADRPALQYRTAAHVAQALAAIHALGYAHLDVRPENFLVDGDGNVLLGDLDGVRPLASQYDGHVRTSLQYRAPELEKRLRFGADVDVFAWGRSLLVLMTSAPRPGEVTRLARVTSENQSCVHLIHDNMGVTLFDSSWHTATLAKLAIRAMADDPRERFPDGAALVAALQ